MADDSNKVARKAADKQVQAREEAEVEESLKEESDSGFALSGEEHRDVAKKSPPRAAVLHEIVRRTGQEELKRSLSALAWSALAAGLTMGFSFVARGLLHRHMEGLPGAYLVEGFGYTFGFLAVIIARQQLFTENTLTAVLPVMTKPTLHNVQALLRLWGVVLAGNLLGTTVFAFGLLHLQQFDADTQRAFLELGSELMHNAPLAMFTKGVMAGWIIAMMVWMMAATERSRLAIIVLCTYVIALGGFTHIVVGSVEAMYMVFAGEALLPDAVLRFALPTLAGNVVGGSLIFALVSHAQVRSDGE
ncbi:formate/nitrite transporter family protein [Luteimonas notoginsengisoli]|uniref:Formate/nitrite transporter family protein n=1 Tax=Luteimonas notoginsengisoli TaxID=1578200 RepID=A0ABV7UT66_9GAMM